MAVLSVVVTTSAAAKPGLEKSHVCWRYEWSGNAGACVREQLQSFVGQRSTSSSLVLVATHLPSCSMSKPLKIGVSLQLGGVGLPCRVKNLYSTRRFLRD